MHPIVEENGGKMLSLWGDMRDISHSHMKRSFQQRRSQILGNCRQLKIDIDSYNENMNDDLPIQLSFNFTNDLMEQELVRISKRQAADRQKRRIYQEENVTIQSLS